MLTKSCLYIPFIWRQKTNIYEKNFIKNFTRLHSSVIHILRQLKKIIFASKVSLLLRYKIQSEETVDDMTC